MDDDIFVLTLRRIQRKMDLVAIAHILYFCRGMAVEDFVAGLQACSQVYMPDGFIESFDGVKDTQTLFWLISYWSGDFH